VGRRRCCEVKAAADRVVRTAHTILDRPDGGQEQQEAELDGEGG
jgi:hypothetical protein